ncbi:hypothetical protein NEOLEDRAFT_1146747 [Neolentinus lepideus HHB14362 ss-1]|uniref:Uncharacterized protein n=1 Tax=Neolentinus lepideus HHB14362 ss-1 TaxID=1314782 RepID=A0A165TUX3_9AGAM|nr:hypothetical protein NEOLEDRAFT_1146747 [Neolentinus lepideus HHB14362 ss-1]
MTLFGSSSCQEPTYTFCDHGWARLGGAIWKELASTMTPTSDVKSASGRTNVAALSPSKGRLLFSGVEKAVEGMRGLRWSIILRKALAPQSKTIVPDQERFIIQRVRYSDRKMVTSERRHWETLGNTGKGTGIDKDVHITDTTPRGKLKSCLNLEILQLFAKLNSDSTVSWRRSRGESKGTQLDTSVGGVFRPSVVATVATVALRFERLHAEANSSQMHIALAWYLAKSWVLDTQKRTRGSVPDLLQPIRTNLMFIVNRAEHRLR